MASIKDLKKRIGTVKNTQQTTRAMKLVSAAKLRRAQDAILAQRPYAKRINEMIRIASGLTGAPYVSPLMYRQELARPDEEKTILLLLVTSDRGLCGAFNANIIKRAQRWVAAEGSRYKEIKWAFLGRKAHEFFKNRGVMAETYQEFGRKAEFQAADQVTQFLIREYLEKRIDGVKIIYNEFKNAISQEIIVEDFLPLHESALAATRLSGNGEEASSRNDQSSDLYIIRPSHPELLEALFKRHFSVQMFRIMLESQASEHGARMSAMENASRNAGEMIRKLTLQFNKQRQAGITKELLEIISGAESQKS